MVEATLTLQQTPAPNHAQRRTADRMRMAVRVLCERRAREEVKAQIRGRMRESNGRKREGFGSGGRISRRHIDSARPCIGGKPLRAWQQLAETIT